MPLASIRRNSKSYARAIGIDGIAPREGGAPKVKRGSEEPGPASIIAQPKTILYVAREKQPASNEVAATQRPTLRAHAPPAAAI